MRVLVETTPADTAAALREAWQAAPSFALLTARSVWTEDQALEALGALPARLHTDHFALLTSGSTGEPKLVVGCRRRAERLVDVLHDAQHSDPCAETVLALPLAYCYAFVNQWLWSARKERALRTTTGMSDPAALQTSLTAAEDAMLCLVGRQVPLLRSYFGARSFPGIIRLHFAGGRFPEAELPYLTRAFPRARIFNNFGCAEALPRLTLREVAAGDADIDIGAPLPGVALRVREGMLEFQSPYRAVAFAGAEGVRLIADEDWIPTGDRAEREGAIWRLLGRNDEVFKRYGEKISLPAASRVVQAHCDGQVALYVDRDGAGEPGYCVVLSPPAEAATVRAILQAFRKTFRRPHWPLRIEGADALPVLPNGKTDRQALRGLPDKVQLWRQRI